MIIKISPFVELYFDVYANFFLLSWKLLFLLVVNVMLDLMLGKVAILSLITSVIKIAIMNFLLLVLLIQSNDNSTNLFHLLIHAFDTFFPVDLNFYFIFKKL